MSLLESFQISRRISFTVSAILLCTLTGCEKVEQESTPTTPSPVTFFSVYQPDQSIAKFPGQVEAAEYSQLSFRIGGKLDEIKVRSGQQVQVGHIIARLDDRDAKAQLANAQSKYDVASAMFERMQTSVEKGAVSQSSFDEARANYLSAKANLTNAQDALSYTELRAPFTGLVASLPVENYQVVTPQQTIVELHVPNAIDVIFQLPEQKMRIIDRARARESHSLQIAWVSFSDSPDKRYPAKYKAHESIARRGELSYEVTITLPKPEDLNILSGMSATVLLDMSKLVARETNVWLVPYGAVVNKSATPNESIVWRFVPDIDDPTRGSVEAVRVNIKHATSEGLLVEASLAEHDRIIAAGAHLVRDAQRVVEWKKEGGL